MNILIINAGSSSLKYQLMDPETGVVSAKGLCERIGIDGRLNHKVGENKVVRDIPMPTHSEALPPLWRSCRIPNAALSRPLLRSMPLVTVFCTAVWNSSIPALLMMKLSLLSRSASPWDPSTTPLT